VYSFVVNSHTLENRGPAVLRPFLKPTRIVFVFFFQTFFLKNWFDLGLYTLSKKEEGTGGPTFTIPARKIYFVNQTPMRLL
jgi:hypothetical protein